MEKVKSPRELLRDLIKRSGRQSFMERTGLSKQYVSNLVSENKPFGPAARNTIEERLGLPAGYFTNGGANSLAPASSNLKGLSVVPLHTWEGAGLSSPDKAGPILQVPMPVSASAYALKMDTDSMMSPSASERSIPPGCWVICDPSAEVKPGDYVIARLSSAGPAACRRLMADSGQLYLGAVNPRYGELHKVGGDIKVASIHGQGSTFSFRLTLPVAENVAAPEQNDQLACAALKVSSSTVERSRANSSSAAAAAVDVICQRT